MQGNSVFHFCLEFKVSLLLIDELLAESQGHGYILLNSGNEEYYS